MVRRCFPVAKIEGSSPSGVVFQYFFLAILTFFSHPPAESGREHPCFFADQGSLCRARFRKEAKYPADNRASTTTTPLTSNKHLAFRRGVLLSFLASWAVICISSLFVDRSIKVS